MRVYARRAHCRRPPSAPLAHPGIDARKLLGAAFVMDGQRPVRVREHAHLETSGSGLGSRFFRRTAARARRASGHTHAPDVGCRILLYPGPLAGP
eukprot:4440014-Prymnesium_polylepis.1